MDIKLMLEDALKNLDALLIRSEQAYPSTDTEAPAKSLEHGRAALTGPVEGMLYAWVEVVVATAALEALLHGVCMRWIDGAKKDERLKGIERAKAHSAQAVALITKLSLNLPAIAAVPFLTAALLFVIPTCDAVHDGSPGAMETLAGILFAMHDQILASYSFVYAGPEPTPWLRRTV
ncbi:MAG: hypothetical protein LBV10_05995 [Stenotrophomonas sp.]|jgi:hypothetical protein|uniref:hypothetical protein n=1 Tax=Stenotrophomonas sp. TaxID=69392 RepID=UPI00283EFBCB|nr:hypothetical protein [Stenotrophomonas sp.]MDR2959080.1 hypothetical protein [Stenotrophomonas sp.]